MSEYYHCVKAVLNSLCEIEYEEWEELDDEKRQAWTTKQKRVDNLYDTIKKHVSSGHKCCSESAVSMTICQIIDCIDDGNKTFGQLCSDKYLTHFILTSYLCDKIDLAKPAQLDFYL